MKLTLRDVISDALTALVFGHGDTDRARGGGLRAGRYRIDSKSRAVLDGVVYVPGVTVTGRLEDFLMRRQSGRLRIGGRAAPHGVLRFHGLRFAGRLGGRRVSGNLRAPVRVLASSARLEAPPLPRLPARKPRPRLY